MESEDKVEETSVDEKVVEETNADENKVEKTDADENKVEETNANKNKVEETHWEEKVVEETNADENKVEETNADENKVEKTDAGENKVEETHSEEKVVEETNADENKVEKTDAGENKVEETNANKNEVEKTNADESNAKAKYDPSNVHYEGDIAIYTDPSSGYKYQWDKEKNEWVAKTDMTYSFEDDTHTYTDSDGIKYFWDKEKSAWFPKIDDEFMARYQLNYGFVDNVTEPIKIEGQKKAPEEELDIDKGVKRKVPPAPPTWFNVEDKDNTNVYVSNLPTDITQEEYVELMQKCGLIMRDLTTGSMKIKLYTEPNSDVLKGDALCTYIKIESVDLALKILDGSTFKGKTIKVERAKFQMKGDYNPTLKPKKKKKDKEKLKKMQQKLFDWRPEKIRGEKAKHEKVVIIKNVFDPSVFDKDVSLILEFQQDLREECSKCGDVRKVMLYDRHPEGVAQVTMKLPEEADEVVKLLNGRWFSQRQLTAEIWDGKTKYKIAETDSQISERLDKWDKFLEDGEKNEGTNKITEK